MQVSPGYASTTTTVDRIGCVSLFVALAILGMAGCGRAPSLPCYPVHGRVLLNGKPLAEAMVVFHPQTPQSQPAPQPLAFTDAEGRFALTTLRNGDGAMVGEYIVTVELRAPRTSGEEVVRDGRNLLPPRYARPETSDFRFAVVAGDNDVPALELKAR